VDMLSSGCHSYWFRWETDSREGSYPEEGSYVFGVGCEDEDWTADRIDNTDTGDSGWGDGELRLKGCSCSSFSQKGAAWWLLLPLMGVVIRRR